MRVKDIVNKNYKSASIGQTVSTVLDKAGHAEWVVIKQNRSLPVGIIETDRLADFHGNKLLFSVARTLPRLVLVPANIEIKRALRFQLLRDIPSKDNAGVLVMDDRTVHGIWSKSDVARTMAAFNAAGSGSGGPSGSIFDGTIGGEIGINGPSIMCNFVGIRGICPASKTTWFNETELEQIKKNLPDEMVRQKLLCENPLKLKPHIFGEKS